VLIANGDERNETVYKKERINEKRLFMGKEERSEG